MSESPEVQIARLEERVKQLVSLSEKESEFRAAIQQWMGSMDQSMTQMKSQMLNVEKSLSSTAPTINEFVTLKHKVIGAGWAGKTIWTTGALIIGFVYGAREQLTALFTRGT